MEGDGSCEWCGGKGWVWVTAVEVGRSCQIGDGGRWVERHRVMAKLAIVDMAKTGRRITIADGKDVGLRVMKEVGRGG